MSEVKMPDKKELEAEYPSNSHSREKRVEKIIQGNVRTRRPSFAKKIRDTFINEDADTIKGYILFDVIVPEIKEVIMETVNIILFGNSRPSGKKKNSSYVSYSSYSSPSYNKPRQTERRQQISDINDIIFESRGEAEEVLSNLVDIVVDYGAATVADLYDLVGVTGSFTDNKYGWTDLGGVNVHRARGGGYIINLPRAMAID